MFQPRVGDFRAIGRVVGTIDNVVPRGQALGYAARAGHGPDIVGIQKGDLRLAQRGIAQQQWISGPGPAANEGECEDNGGAGQSQNTAQEMFAERRMRFQLRHLEWDVAGSAQRSAEQFGVSGNLRVRTG